MMTPKKLSARAIRAFRQTIYRHFQAHGRRLPWRKTRAPYRILVSEVMLQQTQVERVLGFYDIFLTRYPTVEELASARPGEVREAWEGLGYYARARNLHRTARQLIRRHRGHFPKTFGEGGA